MIVINLSINFLVVLLLGQIYQNYQAISLVVFTRVFITEYVRDIPLGIKEFNCCKCQKSLVSFSPLSVLWKIFLGPRLSLFLYPHMQVEI